MDDKKVKYDALDAMWAFVRMGGYQLHPADISSLKDHCEQLRHLLTQKTAGQRRDKREDIDFHELDVITNNKQQEGRRSCENHCGLLQAAGRVPKLHLPLVWVRSLELCDRCL